jgi:ABC-2 type transport system permease protein
MAAAAVLGARLRAEFNGENLGDAPARKESVSSRDRVARRESTQLLDVSGPIAAVIEKELRCLTRTLPQIYAVGAPLLLVLVISGVFLRGGPEGHVFLLALPVCVVYAELGFTQLFSNNLGAEGTGIQLYFLSPTPIRTVILAKNLFHSALYILVALLAAILTSLRLGAPDAPVVAATAAWILFALPCNLFAGNIFSLTMAYRVNPGRISRQRGSQANALISLLVQVCVMAVGALVFWLCWFLDRQWLATPVFLVLAGIATTVWLRGLGHVDVMANARRDTLIATLAKTE